MRCRSRPGAIRAFVLRWCSTTPGLWQATKRSDALKTASHNLLSQLQSAAIHPEDVYVSIVPFSKDVNFGADNFAANWLRWDLWDAVNGNCSNNSYHKQSTCVSHNKIWTPAAHSTWNGCVTDRDQNFDTTKRRTRGRRYFVSGRAIFILLGVMVMGLTNNWTKLERENRRDDAGRQYQPGDRPAARLANLDGLAVHGAGGRSGLQVPDGHHSADRRSQYRRTVGIQPILDRYAPTEDLRQHKGGRHHPVHGAGEHRRRSDFDMLQNCASDGSKFFLLTTAGQMVTTFGQIGTSLSKLRLAM